MIVATDLDDVLADLIAALLPFHNRTYGTRLRKEDLIDYDISKVLAIAKDEMEARFGMFYTLKIFKTFNLFQILKEELMH